MERPLTLKPMSIQDENSVVNHKNGKSKTSRPLANKAGISCESRKALNDITNKSFVHPKATSQSKKLEKKQSDIESWHQQGSQSETLSKNNISINEKLNIAEEGFLHDHSKCIDAQKSAASELHFWDTVLPGHDSKELIMEQPKGDYGHCYPKLEELSVVEFSDWFKSGWKSPPSSPLHQDCSPPYAWEFEAVELVLKEDDYDEVACT